MISISELTFAHAGGTPVFEGFNWQVASGERWAVIGPSGSGKSTLLSLMAGLLFPERGSLLIDGEALRRPRPHSGLIIQDYGLLPWATVRENAALGLRLRGFYGPDGVHAPREVIAEGDVEAWLERLGLLEAAERFPRQISGGQRQRTAIARTLVLQPDLLLMDEPFSAVDAPTRESLQNLVLQLGGEQNLTQVLVTHLIEEAAVMGKQILVLGKMPNRAARVVANPLSGQPGYRGSAEYNAICAELRQLLEHGQ